MLSSTRTIFWVPEDVGRVRELLVNAPADRAWRRRGYLVLCRARPDRLRQIHESSGVHDGVERSISTETGSCTGTAGDGTVDGRTGWQLGGYHGKGAWITGGGHIPGNREVSLKPVS